MTNIKQDKKFIYDANQNNENNFQRWMRWSRRERESYKLAAYTVKEGRIVFDLYFINLDGHNPNEVKK